MRLGVPALPRRVPREREGPREEEAMRSRQAGTGPGAEVLPCLCQSALPSRAPPLPGVQGAFRGLLFDLMCPSLCPAVINSEEKQGGEVRRCVSTP